MGAAPTEPARREVRKVVTILFADLAGSTSLQEQMDPESVRRVMDRFYSTMRSEVEAVGGVVVKFTGDGVMAGFGIRGVREDDALRAIRAAVAMQESFAVFAQEIRDRRGADVSLRIGINTGEVVVSDEDDDVVGDVVNVAARLEHAATPGSILIGGGTWRLTRHDVSFEPVAPLDLKGKAEAVPAHRVVSLAGRGDDEGVAATFVGRTTEMARLCEIFERSASAGEPALVTVVGSPGLGKTRMASEFVASVAERALVLEAKCDPAGTATYAPIADALRITAAISDTASADEVVRAFDVLTPEAVADRARVAKLLASLVGVGDPAPPEETFWAVRRLLEGLASERPVVVVVDDVHWAEPMLLDLLEHIVEWARHAAIVIVALARPEIREVRPALLDADAIILEGLDPDDTASLALSLLGAHDLPEALVHRILASTEGNPLFVRELLRMLVDDGVLSREGDRWVVTIEADDIDVPPTIHALLSARIERLREDERAVVERAAVVGKEFYRGAVMELVPPAVRPAIDSHLENLRRKELVEPEGTYWIDERVFRFHHVLIRDAAYRRLLKEARAELHERFAQWLEAKVGELVGEHSEVLGYHLEQAYSYLKDLGPLDERTASLGRRASGHLAAAVRRALDRDDLAAAENLSGRALALSDDDALRAQLLLDRCEALLAMGDVAAASEAVVELRKAASDNRLAAWAQCFEGQLTILTDPTRLHETAVLVEDAARRLSELGDTTGAAKGHAVHAQALAHLGQFGACEAALDRALAAAREAGDRRRANAVLSNAPLAALWGPSPVPRASGRCLDVVRVLRITAGAPAVEATALRCQAVLEAMRGRADAAHRMLAAARKTLEELGLGHALVECDLYCGLIDLFSGDAAAAEANLRKAYDGFRSLNVGTDAAQAAALLARSLVELGRDDEALALTGESERLGGEDLKTAIAWRTVRARLLARSDEVDAAVEMAQTAVAIAEATDALVDHADARMALSEVLTAAGRGDDARREWQMAADLYARKEAVVDSGISAPAPLSAAATAAAVAATSRAGGVRAAPGVKGDVSAWLRFRQALLDRDWDALAALFTADHVLVDRRSGLHMEVVGRGAFVDGVRAMWQDREHDWDIEVVGAWSDDIGLTRLRSFAEGWERHYLAVTVQRDGLCCRSENIDLSDYDTAFARLDELTYEESRVRLLIERELSLAVSGVTAAGDAALVRVVGDGTAEYAEGAFLVVASDGESITRVEPFADDATARQRLHEMAPNPSCASWLMRHHFDRHSHQDWEALRALNEPEIVIVDHRPVGWGVLRGLEAILEFLQEGARTAQMTPGCLPITEWISITGGAVLFRYRWQGSNDAGVDFAFDRLMLTRFGNGRCAHTDIFDPDQLEEARRLMAGEADQTASRATSGGVWAASGVDAERAVATLTRYRRALLDRDWDALAQLYAEAHVIRDHRIGLRSELTGRLAWVEALRATWQDIESEWRFEVLSAWTDETFLVRVASIGQGWERVYLIAAAFRNGVVARTDMFDEHDYETAFARLDELAYAQSSAKPAIDRYLSAPNDHGWTEVEPVIGVGGVALVRADDAFALVATEDGHVTSIELFGPNDELRARRRLYELAPSASHVRWMVQQYAHAHNAQDWDGIRRLGDSAYFMDDRRPLGWGRLDTEEVIQRFAEGARSTTSFNVEIRDWIAVGPRTCAYVLDWRGITNEGAEYAQPKIAVHTVADSGCTTASFVFDPEQTREAELCLVAQSDRVGPVFRGYGEMLNSRAWENAPEVFDRGYFLIDHRRATFGKRDLPTFVETMKTMVELAPDVRVYPEPVHISATAEVCHLHLMGHTREGGEFLLEIGAALRTRDGIGLYGITFDRADADAAVRWASDHSIGTTREEFESLRKASEAHPVVQAVRTVVAHARNGDWAGVASCFSPDVAYEDQRPLMRTLTRGRQPIVEAVRYQIEGGDDQLEIEIVEDRGPNLVLVRAVKRKAAAEIPLLIIYGLNDDGELSHCILFAEDDAERGRARLDSLDRGIPSVHTPPDGGLPRRNRLVLEAFERGGDLSEMYSPDFRWVDHWNHVELDLEGHLATAQAMAARPNCTAKLDVVVSLGARHGVQRTTFSWDEVDDVVGGSEVSFLSVIRLDQHGRLLLGETFPPDQLHKALARAEELYIEDEATGAAAAGARRRLVQWRMCDAHNAGDLDTLAAVFAPGVVFVDRRPVGWGTVEGRDAVMEVFRAVRYRSVEHRWSISEVHAVADGGCVYTLPFAGTDDQGGSYEGGRVIVTTLTDEGISRLELFPIGAIDDALARFQQLRTEARPEAPAPTIERAWTRLISAMNARDLASLHDTHAETFVMHDETVGRDFDRREFLNSLREMLTARPSGSFRRGRSVTLGRRHGVVEMVWSQTDTGPVETANWYPMRCDDNGRFVSAARFRDAALLASLVRAEELYLEDEAFGAEAEWSRHRLDLWRAFIADNEGDWDTWRSLVDPELVVVDRSALGWGEVDSGGVLERQQALSTVTHQHRLGIKSVAIDRDVVLVEVAGEGTSTDGGRFEIAKWVIQVGTKYQEHFAADDSEEAARRFRELADESRREGEAEVARSLERGTGLSNAYTEFYYQWLETAARGDWERVAALQAPDIVLEDRRPGLQHELAGRDDLVRSQREAVGIGYSLSRIEVVAVRGERLALHRILWRLQDTSEVEMLVVGEMDHHSRMSASVIFDPHDLNAALAELDGRYESTLSAAAAAVYRLLPRLARAYNAHDWTGYLSAFHDDVEVVDHRPAGWGLLHRVDELGSHVRGLVDLVADARAMCASIERVSAEAVVARVVTSGTERSGGRVEIPYFLLFLVRGGKVARYELFPVDQREVALGRFDELTCPRTTIETTWDRLLAALNGQDMAAVAEVYAPHFSQREHPFHLGLDRTALLANIARILTSAVRVQRRCSVWLGDRHAAVEMQWSKPGQRTSGAAEVLQWAVTRCDDEARFVHADIYGERDMLDALERAEVLYLDDEAAGEEAEWARGRLEMWRAMLAYNRGDLDGYAAHLAPDLVTVDHRPASLGEFHTRGAWLAWLREMETLTSNRRFELRSVRWERDVVRIDMTARGTNATGGEYETPLVGVALSGRRQELFAPEQEEEAERRFDELVEHSRRAAGAAPSQTTIEQTWQRLLTAMNARDFEALRDLHAPAFSLRDHAYRFEFDREGQLANLRNVLAQPGEFAPGTAVYLGDRHAVGRMTWAGALDAVGTSEVANWFATRCDTDGRYQVVEAYADDDAFAALERGEELFLEGEAAGEAARWSGERLRMWRYCRAFNSGDLAEHREWLAPDLVAVDHRPAGFGVLHGREAWLGWLHELGERAPDRRYQLSAARLERDVCLLDMVTTGTMEPGGRFEIPVIAVVTSNGTHLDLFDPEQRDDADRRFAELVALGDCCGTTVERAWHRWLTAQNDGDLDTLATLLAEGYTLRDCILHCEFDRSGTLADLQRVLAGPSRFDAGRSIPLGDRHGVFELVWSRGAGQTVGASELTKWFVNRCDATGRFLLTEWYGEHELVQALKRGEELYLQDEAAGDTARSRRRLSFWKTVLAYNAGNWDAVSAGFAPDLVTEDHRPAGWGRLSSRGAYLEIIQGLAGMATERRWVVRSVALEGTVIRLEMDVVGTDNEGGAFVLPFLAVVVLGDRGIEHQVLYVPEQAAEADRRFHELLNERV